ncbi:hypothetical protein SAMN05421819_3718 [Bryocella elongata]|uniref:Uncharacterized protein n=1 Tax=Bryocella elongata TaxID=863522 RepID=A0A1H6BI75_9BACT|nr:DUF6624 domain-containing protein [Bryocella elongata]SEG60292.1 hypothetical protein SAMN05421819_3718 [Bryocella elongata]
MKIKTRMGMAVVTAVLLTLPGLAQQPWEVTLHQRHDALVAKNGPGTDAALRDRLLAMGKEDQSVRFRNVNAPADEKNATAAELSAVDHKLTDELREIYAAHGWPTIAMVGYDASQAAMVILTHSPDHGFQRALLPRLEGLAHADRIDGAQVAVAVDKELVSEGKPQRYGSQFKFVDGQAMMIAVEDSANLDKRRAEVMLPPMDAYRKQLGEMFHVPVSDMIVRP